MKKRPDEIVLVADTAWMIRVSQEEQPRVADSSRGQHGDPRLDRHRPARSDEGAGTADAARDLAVRDQLGDVRSQDDLRVRGGGQTIVLLGIGHLAVLKLPNDEPTWAHRESAGRVGLARRRRVVERPETEVLLRPLVVRRKVVASERPAGMRDRLARFEVECVERARVPIRAPVMGATAECADRREGKTGVGIANALSSEKELRAPGLAGPAALEHTYPNAAPEQLPGQRDPGGAGPNDADVGFELGIREEGPAVDDHRTIIGERGRSAAHPP